MPQPKTIIRICYANGVPVSSDHDDISRVILYSGIEGAPEYILRFDKDGYLHIHADKQLEILPVATNYIKIK